MTELRSFKLFYYDIRGLAEPIRWMFRIANVEFEDIRISLENWEDEKHRFKRHVEQLPVLQIDDKTELTQVHSIMRYLAKQLGFDGDTEMEASRADEIVELLYDLRLCAVAHKQLFTSVTPDIVRHTVFRDLLSEESLSKKVLMKKLLISEDIPKYLRKIDSILQKSGGLYLTGQKLTYADLAFVNFVDICEATVNPDILEDFPVLQDLRDEILDIPEIQEWIEMTGSKSLDAPLPSPTIGA